MFQRYETREICSSFANECRASTRLTVPERERMTIDSVTAPSRVYCTPCSSAPVVTPVAATKTSWPETRSSVVRTRERS